MLQINYTDNKPENIFNKYYDYWYAWCENAKKYNAAFFEATAKSMKSFLNTSDESIQKTQNAMRAAFEYTLRQKLNEESFASSIANLISTRIRFAKLVVYSLINRHYILDLLPKVSVINSLLKQGFDVYATDWGTPDSSYQNMTLEDYAHEYVENAVEKIKEITGSEKVSLFGYCWGGIFALIHSAIHPENVKNLVLHATPIDLEKTNTVIENWTKHIDADELVDTFGNVPGWFLNAAFILRNPVEALLKYWRYFSEPKNPDEIKQFFAIESWLYDSVPIIGPVYREMVNQIYKKNLLIKNKMMVGSDVVDLRKITMPVLNIIGTKDDLVPPDSSRSIMNVIPSTDKKLIEFPTGHVGLCVSPNAHKQLWPEVGKWLAKRS